VAQNVYDDAEFFAAYSSLPRSSLGLDAAPEWPHLRRMVGDPAGRTVVDLGCGFGWFCRWAASHGASSVLGVDLSQRMLERARADTSEPSIVYQRADLEELELPTAAFDLAYSSLTLHYLTDLPRLTHTVAASLVDGGRFVCSVEHPVYTAPRNPMFIDGPDGLTTWPLDGYFREGPRTTEWLAPGVVKQHRTIGAYVAAFADAGFVVTDLVEWGPSDDDLVAHPEWRREVERPAFLLLAAELSGR
jgi:SAM-dependent methyltransferase